ncbi:MAG TPA: FtsX-like permease family protein [Mobilitalea sp.]|nr:FtsX-like permease family protein [Mobilitalea sp.]
MNIINKLTVRQLKLNKKRTLVTILGTIISAAMITAVATLGLCFIDMIQREHIAHQGEWHVIYEDVNSKQLESIASDSETKTTILSREVGYAYLEGSANNNKPYLYIKEYNLEGYKHFPVELSEGRLPKAPNEIVISKAVSTNGKLGYSIGEVLQLSIGQRLLVEPEEGQETLSQEYSLRWKEGEVAEYLSEDIQKSYTIVGIIERPNWEYTWAPGYTVLSYIDADTVTAEEHFDASVIVKNLNNSMFDHAKKLAFEQGITRYDFNNTLLRYYGVIKDDVTRKMLFTLSAIIMGIIMVGSISLIYNAFAISVSERSRYLGMLSSVGATKRQKRNSVFFEGAVIGAISIPIGIIAGYTGLGITFLCINPIITGVFGLTVGLRIALFPSALIIAVLVSISTILLSTYIPARRASNISAIDAIRQTMDVKISRRQVRTSKITRKIFGIEGELGLKNLKRNKGRYRATVFSLIISMVLFLVVTSFTDSMKKSLELTQNGINYDIQIFINGESGSESEHIIEQITSMEDIKDYSRIDSIDASTWVKEDKIADYLIKDKALFVEEGRYPYQVTLNVLDDTAMKKYTTQIGLDYKYTDSDELPIIVINTIQYQDLGAGKYTEGEVVKLKFGDELELSVFDSEAEKSIDLQSLKVTALTDVMPMGIVSNGNMTSFNIIISREIFERIVEVKGEDILATRNTQVYFTSNDPLRLQENLEELQNTIGISKLSVNNLYSYRQSEEQMIFLMSVFTNAFIILITAICAANILNTVSTSIALRKREFAMLKSVGMTPKGFNRMLNYESIFYGIKALLYGLPISFALMLFIHKVLMSKFSFTFTPPIMSICIVIIAVFILVGTAMLYSGSKVKKDNIIDALKQEII